MNILISIFSFGLMMHIVDFKNLNISNKQIEETALQFDLICQEWSLLKAENLIDKTVFVLDNTQRLTFDCEKKTWSISDEIQSFSSGLFEIVKSKNEIHLTHSEGTIILKIIELSFDKLIYEYDSLIYYFSR
jgi:hypothetical protein